MPIDEKKAKEVSESFKNMSGMGPTMKEAETKKEDKPEKSMLEAMMRKMEGMGS